MTGPSLIFDADGDGTNDLLLTASGVGQPAGSPAYQPRLYLNDGSRKFATGPGGRPASAFPQRRRGGTAADFNRDGLLDVFLEERKS